MNIFHNKAAVIVTCNNRLAPWLKLEVEALGHKPVRNFSTGVELFLSLKECISLNLKLRCASQVLYSLKKFRANHPDDVYKNLASVNWEDILNADDYFSVTSHVDNPSITTPLYANLKVKDAIVDRIRDKQGKRPDTGPATDRAVVHLYWKDENAEIFLDTSGDTLAKHGFRKIPGKAPMLEALASGTLYASSWDRKSTFLNPMCGSGTVAIQAALLATNRYPGLYRDNYSFMHLKGFDDAWYKEELRAIMKAITEVEGLKVIASDISEDAIEVSKTNASLAGVEDIIDFVQCDFRESPVPEENRGAVFFNPEYGERLGVDTDLEEIYGLIGDFLKKRCGGYAGYVFTGNLELAKKIGLKPKRRYEFYSAKIDCRLLEYELYAGSRTSMPISPA